MSLALSELGEQSGASAHAREALDSGREFADVPAELSFAAYATGEREAASELLVRARVLVAQGQSDLMGDALVQSAAAMGEVESNPRHAQERLSTPLEAPLDFGYSSSRRVVLVQALIADGNNSLAQEVATDALATAKARGVGRVVGRLGVLVAIAADDARALAGAMAHAARSGDLALPEIAPSIVQALHLLEGVPNEIASSIRAYPQRWLPLIRRRLEHGDTPSGQAAASLLDEFGTLDDVGLLRAYAKTYGKRGPSRSLGKKLARQVSPVLEIQDLGRVQLVVGSRKVLLAQMRRKPGSVLMFLVTRPAMAANREEVIDELWRDADPGGAINNLNQSLYFLRREIDPWFEDDVSVEYVRFQGDLVWLDPELVRASSHEFVASAQRRHDEPLPKLAKLLRQYRAPFAPEFEYDEWAHAWRTRLRSTFLDVAHTAIRRFVKESDLASARDLASRVLEVDPTATDVERRLVWLYARLGLLSAAKAQYRHLKAAEEADELDTPPFRALIRSELDELV
jgi:DNA-binding SARP family transcriptional activator